MPVASWTLSVDFGIVLESPQPLSSNKTLDDDARTMRTMVVLLLTLMFKGEHLRYLRKIQFELDYYLPASGTQGAAVVFKARES